MKMATDTTYMTPETVLDLADLLLVSPKVLRATHALPPRVELPLFSAELHLVHQVVARKILGQDLYARVLNHITVPDTSLEPLMAQLRPCLATWVYYYALPNFYLLLPEQPNAANQHPQQLELLRRSTRHQAEEWTRHVVEYLTANPLLFPEFNLTGAARAYMGSPKVM